MSSEEPQEEQQQRQDVLAATATATAASSLLDALPYIDPPPDDDYEQYALALIEEEMKKKGNNRNDMFASSGTSTAANLRTPALREAYERIETSQQQKPPPASPPKVPPLAAPGKDETDIQVWENAIQQAKIAYETERLRNTRLEVDRQVLVGVWKDYNETLQQQELASTERLQDRQAVVDGINFSRQTEQTSVVGRQLQILQTQYEELIQKQFQLKTAIAQLEQEQKNGTALTS